MTGVWRRTARRRGRAGTTGRRSRGNPGCGKQSPWLTRGWPGRSGSANWECNRYGRRGVTRGRSTMLDGKHRVGAERLTIMDGHPGGHFFWWVPFALLFWFIWLPALIYVLRRGLWGRRDIGV